MARLTKTQKREVELWLLMEAALASDESWRHVLLKRNLEGVPITSYANYTPAMLEYLSEQRRILRNALVYGGMSGRIDANPSEGHLYRVLSDVVTMHDKRLRHPVWAEYLMHFLLPKSERDALSGDLIEEFRTTMVPKFGPRAARFWFVKQVLSSIWPVLKRRVLRALGILAIIRYFWR